MKKALFLGLILAIALSQTLSFAGWSSDNVWENPLTLGDPSYDATNYFGLKIRTLGNITAINGTRIIGVHYESNPYTTTRIYASDGLTLLYSNDSGNGNWANFSDAVLNASTNYSIVGVPSGNRIYNDGTAFPYASTDFDIICGCGGSPPTACYGGSSYISFEFDKIISQTYMPTINNITDCQEAPLNSNVIYYLISDILNTSLNECFYMPYENTTLDCLGHLIDGQDIYSSVAIYYSNTNITIKNCKLKDWNYGIYGNGQNALIYNNQFLVSIPVDIYSYIPYFNTTNSTGTNILNQQGIGGNYWALYSPTCDNFNGDSFCDVPFLITTDVGNAYDYLPLTSNNYTEPINITYPSLTTEVCLDNQILNKTKATYNLTGLSFLEIEYVNCSYGCDSNSCKPNPFYMDLFILILIIASGLIIWRLI